MCGGMFQLAQVPDTLRVKGGVSQLDGMIDESPIVPPQVMRREFEHLLDFTYGDETLVRWQSPPYPLDFLIAILKLTSQWDMAKGREFAVYHLKQVETDMPPALRLKLARVYDLDDWLLPAFHELVLTPLSKLTPNDKRWLGWTAYDLIARAHEQAEALRKTLALVPPPMDDLRSPKCIGHNECIRVWGDLWFSKIGRRVLHPNPVFALKFWECSETIPLHQGSTVHPRKLE
ncbi:hypothetical protein A0H81_03756 [Grifola frondosa]|uniref:BTB domain-containing protein n=1 Tax=Grifola frondosa TaxID=5627 RepID=A0A1C7MJI3_GRIFR|nr:hypothetical protein A0H81_03756 [Grifola frondosa]